MTTYYHKDHINNIQQDLKAVNNQNKNNQNKIQARKKLI